MLLYFKNYNWQAKIQMYTFGYYPAKGSLLLNSSSITLDPDSGYTLFSNISIDKVGMYLLSIRIYSIGQEFSTQCFSNLITISKPLNKSNTTNSTLPNYKLKFSGNYYNLTEADKIEIKANVYNYVSIYYNLSVYDIDLYPGSVIVVFYSPDSNSDLISQLIQSGLNISSLISFLSAEVNGNTLTCSSCVTPQVFCLLYM